MIYRSLKLWSLVILLSLSFYSVGAVPSNGLYYPKPTPTQTSTPTITPTVVWLFPFVARQDTHAPRATATATASSSPTPSSTPETTCPDSVHAKYTALGPDGKVYPTWHPQRDPSGCYFHHEHGSNPARFVAAASYQPVFGYLGGLAGIVEPHEGFKNFLVDDGVGHQWLFTVHIGTTAAARACVRFHSVDLAIGDIATGQLLAAVHFLGDFGPSVDDLTQTPLQPSACPTQYDDAIAADSNGVRELSVDNFGDDQYEPWRVDTRRLILGLHAQDLLFNTLSSLTSCNGYTCNRVSFTSNPGRGSFRLFEYGGLSFVSGALTGQFTTDPKGQTSPGLVVQYVAPGVSITAPSYVATDHYWPTDPLNELYRLVSGNSPVSESATNIDGQIQPPN